MSRKAQQDGGYILVFIAIGIIIFLGMISMAINMSYARSLRTEMQDAVDSAAHAAASILCSTFACYEDAMGIAITMLEEKTSEGIIKSGVDMDSAGGSYSWTNGITTITIHRGRWWPASINTPYDGPTQFFHENGFFEDFDTTVEQDGAEISWQQEYPQLPAFFVSNAVYVKAEVKYKNSFFNVFNISNTTLTTEAYGVAGDAEQEVCIAPFAISTCAMLNNQGQYDKDNACLYERFFTESNRYCEKNSGGELEECEIVPGSVYRAFPKDPMEAEDISVHTQFLFDDESDIKMSRTVKENPSCMFFCAMTETHLDVRVNLTCDFKSSPNPVQESPADFFGLVGMPMRWLEESPYASNDYSKEEVYSEVLRKIADESNFCVGARIGDDFRVLNRGLTTTDSADAFQYVMQSANVDIETFGSRYEVIYHSLLPKDAELIPTQSVGGPEVDTIHTELGCANTSTRHGICNSKLFSYDTKCLVDQDLYETIPSNTHYLGRPLYSANMIACPVNPNSLPLPIYRPSNLTEQEIPDVTEVHLSPAAKTWTVAIPIVAPKGSGDIGAACAGVLSRPAPDPIFDEETEYTIVGFTKINFFDHDIGNSPAQRGYLPPGDLAAWQSKLDAWDAHWSNEEEPWGFRDTIAPLSGGAEEVTSCHMIKGMQTCDQGLISAPQYVISGNREVTIAVPY